MGRKEKYEEKRKKAMENALTIAHNKHLNKLRLEKICPFVNGKCIEDKCIFYFKDKMYIYKSFAEEEKITVGCRILSKVM